MWKQQRRRQSTPNLTPLTLTRHYSAALVRSADADSRSLLIGTVTKEIGMTTNKPIELDKVPEATKRVGRGYSDHPAYPFDDLFA